MSSNDTIRKYLTHVSGTRLQTGGTKHMIGKNCSCCAQNTELANMGESASVFDISSEKSVE